MRIPSVPLALSTVTLLLLGSTGPAFAEESPEATATEGIGATAAASVGTINGLVLDANTGLPLRSDRDGEEITATVLLFSDALPPGTTPPLVNTAADGSFMFEAEPGDYELAVTQAAPGAVWEHITRTETDGLVPEGQRVPVTVSDGIAVDVTVEMHRAATLTLGPIRASSDALANWDWVAVAKYFAPGVSQGNASDGVVEEAMPLVGSDPALTVYITAADAYRPDAVVWGCVTGSATEVCSEPGLKVTPGTALAAGPFVFAADECSGAECTQPTSPPVPPEDQLPETGATSTSTLAGLGLTALLLGAVLRIAFRRDAPLQQTGA